VAVTAVIGDTASVGFNPLVTGINIRRNPSLATARIRTVVAPHIVSDAVGGWISADFTIPAEEALRWKPILKYGAVVWMFDGLTPIFYGWAEQPVWTQTGDCQMTVSGPWALLGRARMREAWELWDMTLLTKGTGANENKAGSVNLNSDGTLTLSIPAGVIAASDRCSVDYLLFGETVGTYDTKLITAFEFDVSDSLNLSAARRIRVIGKANAAVSAGDQLWDSGAAGASTVQGALNLNGTNQGAAAWPSTVGYRCLRFEIVTTGAATIASDWYATFDRIRIGTREAIFPNAGGTMDTAALARDVVNFRTQVGSAADLDVPQEFWPSQRASAGSPDSNTFPYKWGLDPVFGTGTAPNSGVGITGFTALEWQSPADILAALAGLDGFHVGFYLPYNGRGGYDPPGFPTDFGSFWLTAPPQLYYQPFPDPNQSPDYVVYTRQGAQITQTAAAQPLEDRLYVNYQTNRGRQLSSVVTDIDTRNYAAAQGFIRSEDYTIQPAVGSETLADAAGQQQLALRRQPYAAATITIENDGSTRSPILKSGANIVKLAQIRPGSLRIADITASSGLRAGYATHVEWWGATLSSNEKVELSLTQPPGQISHQRAHGHLATRIVRMRIGHGSNQPL
jgi:hypothetical protein